MYLTFYNRFAAYRLDRKKSSISNEWVEKCWLLYVDIQFSTWMKAISINTIGNLPVKYTVYMPILSTIKPTVISIQYTDNKVVSCVYSWFSEMATNWFNCSKSSFVAQLLRAWHSTDSIFCRVFNGTLFQSHSVGFSRIVDRIDSIHSDPQGVAWEGPSHHSSCL